MAAKGPRVICCLSLTERKQQLIELQNSEIYIYSNGEHNYVFHLYYEELYELILIFFRGVVRGVQGEGRGNQSLPTEYKSGD